MDLQNGLVAFFIIADIKKWFSPTVTDHKKDKDQPNRLFMGMRSVVCLSRASVSESRRDWSWSNKRQRKPLTDKQAELSFYSGLAGNQALQL